MGCLGGSTPESLSSVSNPRSPSLQATFFCLLALLGLLLLRRHALLQQLHMFVALAVLSQSFSDPPTHVSTQPACRRSAVRTAPASEAVCPAIACAASTKSRPGGPVGRRRFETVRGISRVTSDALPRVASRGVRTQLAGLPSVRAFAKMA